MRAIGFTVGSLDAKASLTLTLSRKRERGNRALYAKIRCSAQERQTMATTHPIDTNQIRARIGDLKERVASLRGYL